MGGGPRARHAHRDGERQAPARHHRLALGGLGRRGGAHGLHARRRPGLRLRAPARAWPGVGRGVHGRAFRWHPYLRKRLPVLLHAHVAGGCAQLPPAARRRLSPLVHAGQLRDAHQHDGRGRGPRHHLPAGAHERLNTRGLARGAAQAHWPARAARHGRAGAPVRGGHRGARPGGALRRHQRRRGAAPHTGVGGGARHRDLHRHRPHGLHKVLQELLALLQRGPRGLARGGRAAQALPGARAAEAEHDPLPAVRRVLRGRRPAHSRGRGLRRLPPVLRRHRHAAELPGRGARRVREPCQRAARGR